MVSRDRKIIKRSLFIHPRAMKEGLALSLDNEVGRCLSETPEITNHGERAQ